MEAKINNMGNLLIKRAGKFKSQYCPYAANEVDTACGDWCPKFGEDQVLFLTSIGACGITYTLVEDERSLNDA